LREGSTTSASVPCRIGSCMPLYRTCATCTRTNTKYVIFKIQNILD
jgi:hypothetical protein